jgi:hypothetical protein
MQMGTQRDVELRAVSLTDATRTPLRMRLHYLKAAAQPLGCSGARLRASVLEAGMYPPL